MDKKIQSLFKQYIVKRKNGQCQVLIPLIELDDLCDKLDNLIQQAKEDCIETIWDYGDGIKVSKLKKIEKAIRSKE